MRQNLGRDLSGMKVFIIGDILHSRVARSDIMGFRMLGMEVTLVAPPTLMPRGIGEMGVNVEYDLANLKDADVIDPRRASSASASSPGPTISRRCASTASCGTTPGRGSWPGRAGRPGFINLVVEIASDIADDDENLIAHQVFSGLAVRMAILYRTIVGYSDGSSSGEVF